MTHGFSGFHMRNEEIDNLDFDSDECSDFIENHLIDELARGDAIGVCKFYLNEGYESLSEKQKNAFKITLQQNLLKCGRCEEFDWIEAKYIIEHGLCSYCQKVWDSD